MALRWDEASMIVTCGKLDELGDGADDSTVIRLRPGEASDPDVLEAVAGWVVERTMSRRRAAGALGYSLPDPAIDDEGLDEEAAAAERALLDSLRERGRAYESFALDLLGSGLMAGDAGSGARIFVGRVEELVVSG